MAKNKDVSQSVVTYIADQARKGGMSDSAAQSLARESAERVNRKRREQKKR